MAGQSTDLFSKSERSASRDGAEIAPEISLPKGGGAIRSIGEKFVANPANGTATFTVPIALSPGRSGFGPQISLSYDSGSGNGPFGLGWNISIPTITRRTDKGLPQYQDDVDSDIFILAGAEDMVPFLIQDGSEDWIPELLPPRNGYTIKCYRPRIEGLFARIERWTRQEDGDTYWRSISKDNITTVYGETNESRIADPENPGQVFSWLISHAHDDKGDAILYSYKKEDSANVDLSQVNERNRSAPGLTYANCYLRSVKYGNTQSLLVQMDITKVSWLFEAVFDYGEGYFEVAAPNNDGFVFASATLEPAGTWPVRQDPFSHYRSRFEVRTYRLCRRVLMFHHFEIEPSVLDGLVRATEFTYQENPIASVMTEVTQSGYVRQADGTYLQASLPSLAFQYSQAQVENQVREVDPESLANLPANIDGSRFRWLDLDGEGLQCVFAEQENAWFYKRNLTPVSLAIESGQLEPSARFEDLMQVSQLPALAQSRTPRHQFMNIVGDGRLDCVVLERTGAGFYERTANEDWEPFAPLISSPNIDWDDPNLRLIDIDGDGFSDVLITDQDSLTYYPSLARFGFDAPVRLPKPTDEEAGPAVVFADSTKSIFLADMSGDGLSDIVRIRNGEVCYWPNLGYGRFGTKVTMDNSPWFDLPDSFDPARIRLGDIDGSGVTDIIYLAVNGVRLYFNQSGNSWSEPAEAIPFPPVSNLAAIQALDLMGNGTVCLVWTSSSPGDVGRSMRYVNLMGRDKPYLMVRVSNNLGAETRITYTPSTAFYLADRAAGKPWATRLPFPVHVVERVETYDWISRNRFVTRYAYHHGYYDGTEREFRGFGMVEQRDTEELGILTQTGAFPDGTNIEAASYVPPALTRTWFHTGAYPMGLHVTRIYDCEYWREPNLDLAEATATLLPDSPLQPDLTGDEIREALRALKGSILHQEVYALSNPDGSRGTPYSVSERNYTVNRLQPFGPNRHAVFLTHARESLDLQYDRKTYTIDGNQVADPRTSHAIVLEVDEFANVKKSVAIGYGRRYQDPNPHLLPSDLATQSDTLVTFSESDYTNAILTADDAYRTRMPAEVRTYELTGYIPTGIAGRFQDSDFVTQTKSGISLIFDEEIAYEARFTAGKQRRPIEQVRTLYRSDNLSGGLMLGVLDSRALPFANYKLAMTPGLLTQGFERPKTDLTLENLLPDPSSVLKGAGGYVLSDDQKTLGLFPASDGDGYWWIPSGQIFYSTNATDPTATELENAKDNFFLGRRYCDIFGNNTTVTYDAYDLLPVQVQDPVQNVITAVYNYRVLQPKLLTDPNGNQSAAAFDALGLVVATAVTDKSIVSPTLQDSVADVVADPTQSQIDAFFADPRGPMAAQLLGSATSRVVYDFSRFLRPPSTQAPMPSFAATIVRETHVQALGTTGPSQLQVSISYSDGLGREIQKKAQADPGPLVPDGPVIKSRWICSGWTIFNNKGKPVRKYEPFFTDSPDFESGVAEGVSSTLFYDPIGRVVATLHADHSWEKVIFDPWRQEGWDANDTVSITDPSQDADVGSYFKRIPDDDYKPTWAANQSASSDVEAQDAARKAAIHAGTYSTVHFDSLGRAFLSVAFNRSQLDPTLPPIEGHYRTTVDFDIEGNQRSITDALERVIMTYDYDMLGSRLHQTSVDSGDRWILNNATGKPYVGWDSRDHRLQHDYDAARRPTKLWVQTGSQTPALAEQTIYGETQSSKLSNPQQDNLCGRVYQQFDNAGVVTNTSFDFKGNLLASSRELRTIYRDPVDWSLSPVPALTGEVFTASSTFDALNRPVTMTAPDGSITRPTYDQAGVLDQVNINLQGAAAVTAFVTEIDYDAKGQRTLIQFGNGSQTKYTYDKYTYRLTTLTTTHSTNDAILQALSYTYDPVGNITNIQDAAQQRVFFSNQIVDASNDYIYDALYRLIQSKGRESIGLAGQPQTTWDDSARMNQQLPLPSDTQALQIYTETYSYDKVGNFSSLAHSATVGSWTRTYAYDEPHQPPRNNRLTSTQIGQINEPYTYDPHGNMLSMLHLRMMAWDFKDQLQATQKRNGGDGPVETTYYVYDGSGQRVRKINESAGGNIANERIYLGAFEIYREYEGTIDPSLERQTLYVTDNKQRIALVETLAVASDGSPRQLIRYQFGSHLGSSVLELDEMSKIISYEEYYPYGSTSFQAMDVSIKTAAKRFRFTGKERDEETGLNYHGARYYAPWIGRWTSADPTGTIAGVNLFCYVKNNPSRYSDPSGRDKWDTAASAAWGAALGIYDLARAAKRTVGDPGDVLLEVAAGAVHEYKSISRETEVLGKVGAPVIAGFAAAASVIPTYGSTTNLTHAVDKGDVEGGVRAGVVLLGTVLPLLRARSAGLRMKEQEAPPPPPGQKLSQEPSKSSSPPTSEKGPAPTAQEVAADSTQNLQKAYIGNLEVQPQNNLEVYHGTQSSPAEVIESGQGLPERTGTRDLYDHQRGKASAFRGATTTPDVAASFAQPGNWVYEIKGVRGWDLNKSLQGRIGTTGDIGGSYAPGEGEFAIEARVPVERISRFGRVVETARGKPVVIDWTANPLYQPK